MTLSATTPLVEKILRTNLSGVLQGWYYGYDADQVTWYLYHNYFRQTWRTHILENPVAKRWELARRAYVEKYEVEDGFVFSLRDFEMCTYRQVLENINAQRLHRHPFPLDSAVMALDFYSATERSRPNGQDFVGFAAEVTERLIMLIKGEVW